jgi:DNA-binding XRE family transcriptional regulator
MHGNTKLPRALGKKIQRHRKALKLTQGELAEKVGISEVYMGFIEQGRYAPSLEVLNKIAKGLKVKVSDLF